MWNILFEVKIIQGLEDNVYYFFSFWRGWIIFRWKKAQSIYMWWRDDTVTTTKLARQTRGTGEMHYLNTSYSYYSGTTCSLLCPVLVLDNNNCKHHNFRFRVSEKKLLVKLVTLVLDTVSYNKIVIRVLTSGKFMIHNQWRQST